MGVIMNHAPAAVPVDTAAADAIRRLIAAAEEHQSDTAKFIDLHRSDAVIVNLAGRRVIGRETLRPIMSAALDGPFAKVFTRIDVQDIQFLRPDVALVLCLKRISDQREVTSTEPGQELASSASLTFVVTREHDEWLIASAQTTPVLTI
jgi:uncharacterized protein (TIGR02246 family)